MAVKKNLALIGMMGSGKSTIGLLISKKLNFNFIDSDKEIEKYEKCTIKEIFEKKGEKYFREIEESFLIKKLGFQNTVISLGGGGFLNNNIRKKVLKDTISFWLNWKQNTLVDRIIDNKKRPLVTGLSRKELINLINLRSLIYKKAKYKIYCENLNKHSIVKKILRIYESENFKN